MSITRVLQPRMSAGAALLASLLSALPLTVDLGAPGSGFLAVADAAAKDGRDRGGSGGDDGGGNNSGSGSDNSGSGGDDSGSGGDDSGSDSSGRGSGDDGGDDSGSGREGGEQDSSGPDRGGRISVGRSGERVEFRGDRLEIIYQGGWTEEIRDGRLEMKDPKGRTVVERRATPEDYARLRALAP